MPVNEINIQVRHISFALKIDRVLKSYMSSLFRKSLSEKSQKIKIECILAINMVRKMNLEFHFAK